MSDNQQAGLQHAALWARIACSVAVTLTLVVSAVHTSVSSQWHDDAALVRTLGAWPLEGQGVVSTLLTQFTLLLPLGNSVLRAGVAANLGGGVACLSFFYLLHRLLQANAHTPRLTIALAMLGSLLLSLSQPMQTAASAADGASVGFALMLAAITVHARLSNTRLETSRLHALLGAVLVVAIFERFWAGVLACAVIGAERAWTRRGPRVRTPLMALGGLLAASACCVPLVRMLRPHRTLPELPLLGESVSWFRADWGHLSWGGVRWWAGAGSLLLAAALLGAAWAVAKSSLRSRAVGWLGVLLLASIVGEAAPSPLRESPTSVLRLAAFASVVLFATLAAQTFAILLLRSRTAYVGSSVLVIPALYVLLIAVNADEADIAAEAASRGGNEAFTQEAVWTLPRNSVLLVRTPELALRVWAERLAHGMRPDVLVVTPRQLRSPGRFKRLLEAEPALAPLIREWVLRGRPSEYVLSQLADVRPVFLELDESGDLRLREHLSSWGLWLEYHSQSLGRSDRYAKMSTTRPAVERVIEVSKGSVPPDESTLNLVALRLKEQLLVSAGLGDRPVLYPLLEQLERTGAQRDFAKNLRKILAEKPQGLIEWKTLRAL